MSYDRRLEAPYQDAAEASERFTDWCEEHNMDPDHPDAETLYQDYIDAAYDPDDLDDDDYEGDYKDDGPPV